MAGCFPCLFAHFKFLRYIDKQALVQLDIWSKNFRTSSKQAYFLLRVRHGDRGTNNDPLLEFVLR